MEVRRLFRDFLKTIAQFQDYNTKQYFFRWTKAVFKTGELDLPTLQSELEMLKRQVIIQKLYPGLRSVIEDYKRQGN